MATLYMDLLNGNDANDGTSFANRFKTFTFGATAARIAPGDTIRVMKTPDPTSIGNATWTNASATLLLASALTKTVDMCETAWTGSANVTSTATTTRKEGSNALSLAIAAGFTTGIVAYKDLGSNQDFSAYQQISFWFRTNLALAATTLRIDLCSDAVGAVPVDSFTLPLIPAAANAWQPITLNKGSALGSAIRSVSVYAIADPGTATILLDNIIACKPVGDPDALTLNSIVSKGTVAEPSYRGIASINGTTVMLARANSDGAGSGGIYYGTTETVPTYHRIGVYLLAAASSGVAQESIQDAGTAGSPITFSGGWDTTDMSTQTGETFIDAGNALGQFNVAQNYVTIDKIWVFRAFRGWNISTNSGCIIQNLQVGCGQEPISFSGRGGRIYNVSIAGSSGNGLSLPAGMGPSLEKIWVHDCVLSGIVNTVDFNGHANNITTMGCNIGIYNQIAGVYFTDVTMKGNLIDCQVRALKTYFKNWIAPSATETNTTDYVNANTTIYSQDHDGTPGNHRIFMEGGTIMTETGANRRTLSGVAWRMSPTSTVRRAEYPMQLVLGKVYCAANVARTLKVWMKRTNTGLTASLVVKGGQLAGVATDVSSSLVGAASVYEEVSVTFTPTEAGVIEFEAQCYGGTTYDLYLDDLSIT